jgi:hypothetical protein
MRLLLFRTAGVLTIASVAVIFLLVATQTSIGGALLLPLYLSLTSMVCGLLLMIIHINVTKVISDEEKASWRRRFKWAAPIVAGWYLWAVADKSAVARH